MNAAQWLCQVKLGRLPVSAVLRRWQCGYNAWYLAPHTSCPTSWDVAVVALCFVRCDLSTQWGKDASYRF